MKVGGKTELPIPFQELIGRCALLKQEREIKTEEAVGYRKHGIDHFNVTFYSLSTYHMPGIMLSFFIYIIPFNLPITIQGRCYYYHYFREGETGAQ